MDAQGILEALSEVMNEQSDEDMRTEQERLALGHYNNIRRYIGQDLVKCMDTLSYRDKFTVIEHANTLLDTIDLCMHFPELINKYIIGCYEFAQDRMKLVCGKYVGKEIIFSRNIPTILTHGKRETDVHALNLAGKRIAISKMVYQKMESGSADAVNLSGILFAYHLYSTSIPEDKGIILFPKGCDKRHPYYKSLFLMLDTLIAYSKNIGEALPEMEWDLNLKKLVLIGFPKDEMKIFLKRKAGCFKGKIVIEQTATKVLDMEIHRTNPFDLNCGGGISNNFCNQIVMESCLCSTLWYLARQREELNSRIAQVNNSLISDDKATRKQAKRIQEEIKRTVYAVDKCSIEYLRIAQKILSEIGCLQENYGIDEDAGLINQHMEMGERILELLAVEGIFYKQYPDKLANEHIRKLNMLYGKICADSGPADVLAEHYFSEISNAASLGAFARHETGRPALLHIKLEMYNELGLSVQECRQIIIQLNGGLTALEHRLLGIANLEQGDLFQARAELMCALHEGDREAGELLYRNELYDDFTVLADNGVAEAAYKFGKELFYEFGFNQDSKVRRKMMKYLHIAAAKEHKEALQLLGDIWYDESMNSGVEMEEQFKCALHYYQIVERMNGGYKQLYERVGLIYYKLQNYLKARTYLEKADTTEACYILGVMYDTGQGTSRNRDKALCYYQRAATQREGHHQAMLALNRIRAEMDEEKKKSASENAGYQRTSQTTNYSSTSGWL